MIFQIIPHLAQCLSHHRPVFFIWKRFRDILFILPHTHLPIDTICDAPADRHTNAVCFFFCQLFFTEDHPGHGNILICLIFIKQQLLLTDHIEDFTIPHSSQPRRYRTASAQNQPHILTLHKFDDRFPDLLSIILHRHIVQTVDHHGFPLLGNLDLTQLLHCYQTSVKQRIFPVLQISHDQFRFAATADPINIRCYILFICRFQPPDCTAGFYIADFLPLHHLFPHAVFCQCNTLLSLLFSCILCL